MAFRRHKQSAGTVCVRLQFAKPARLAMCVRLNAACIAVPQGDRPGPPRSAERDWARGYIYAQGVGMGTSQGAGASMDLKSAGDTISRYSMSGE